MSKEIHGAEYRNYKCPNGHLVPLDRRWCPSCGRPKPKPGDEDLSSIQIHKVPRVIRHAFKSACIINGSNVRKEILRFVMTYIKEYDPNMVLQASAAESPHNRGEHDAKPSPYCPKCWKLRPGEHTPFLPPVGPLNFGTPTPQRPREGPQERPGSSDSDDQVG